MAKKVRINWYETGYYVGIALFILGFLVTLSWAIGKAVGLIHSPMWVNMLPIISAVIGIFGAAFAFTYKAGNALQRLAHVESNVHILKKDAVIIKKGLETTRYEMNSRLVRIETKLGIEV